MGIYWNNHHHMLHMARSVNGKVLWANLHLLFWLSLIPFVTAWLGEAGLQTATVAAYGAILNMSGLAYYILSRVLIAHLGHDSQLAAAIGTDYKGIASLFIYILGIIVAFINPQIAFVLYVLVALMWFIPDRRIENMIAKE